MINPDPTSVTISFSTMNPIFFVGFDGAGIVFIDVQANCRQVIVFCKSGNLSEKLFTNALFVVSGIDVEFAQKQLCILLVECCVANEFVRFISHEVGCSVRHFAIDRFVRLELSQHVVDLLLCNDRRVVFMPDLMREFGNMLAIFF